jgi:uncharacterized protein YeaO (DUF488 family)
VTGKTEPRVRVARVYDGPAVDDGWRVLVDRLWPRGLRKEDLRLDEWCKDLAPSTELRSEVRPPTRPIRGVRSRRYERELDDPTRCHAV